MHSQLTRLTFLSFYIPLRINITAAAEAICVHLTSSSICSSQSLAEMDRHFFLLPSSLADWRTGAKTWGKYSHDDNTITQDVAGCCSMRRSNLDLNFLFWKIASSFFSYLIHKKSILYTSRALKRMSFCIEIFRSFILVKGFFESQSSICY